MVKKIKYLENVATYRRCYYRPLRRMTSLFISAISNDLE